MTEPCTALLLNNGLTVQLFCSETLTSDSACIQAAAGSLDEPADWPGLAHLLEHLLFQGGLRFTGEQRLMPWVTTRGGRVNATTGLHQTLCYFDLAGADFSEAMARLLDMVSEPRLEPAAISRETEVIDAEFGLLSRHAPTLIDAFLRSGITAPAEYSRFITGNRDSFAADTNRLRQALRDFHQQYYAADNLCLLIRSPRPVSQQRIELEKALTAAGLSDWLPVHPAPRRATPSPVMLPQRAFSSAQWLQMSGETHHCLDMIISDPNAELRAAVPLLQTLVTDAAPGSLLYHWRQKGWCHTLSLDVVSAARGYLWVMLRLLRPASAPLPAGQLTADWRAWLQQLTTLSARGVTHYQQLALQQFRTLSPMEQLRQIAAGLGESDRPIGPLAVALLQQSANELQTVPPGGDKGMAVMACGFPCIRLTPSTVTADSFLPLREFIFYPQTLSPPAIIRHAGAAQGDCPFSDSGEPGVRLVMSPVPGTTLTAAQHRLLENAVQPVFSLARHLGGDGGAVLQHAVPWLFISVTDVRHAAVIFRWLAALWPEDFDLPPAEDTQQVLIRRLLAEFPSMSARTESVPRWNGRLQCPAGSDYRELNAILKMTIAFQSGPPEPPAAILPQWRHHPATDEDNAILFFLPLPEGGAKTTDTAKSLAGVYQPAFYQWLREELSVGYVVSCRFQQFAQTPGIMCALQSPGFGCDRLAAWCRAFFRRVTPQINQLSACPPVSEAVPLHPDPQVARLAAELLPADQNIQPAADNRSVQRVSQLQQLHHWLSGHTENAIILSYGRR